MITSHKTRTDLLDGPIVVVCGGGLQKDGTLTQAARLRAEAAAAMVAEDLHNSTVIFSGDGRNHRRGHQVRQESVLLAGVFVQEIQRLIEHGRTTEKEYGGTFWEEFYQHLGADDCEKNLYERHVRVETQAQDIIGSAVLVAARYLQWHQPRCMFPLYDLYVVTSPFQEQQAQMLFAGVLGSEWEVTTYVAEPPEDRDELEKNEASGIEQVRRFFDGVEPGDLAALVDRLCELNPAFYNQLEWLKTSTDGAMRPQIMHRRLLDPRNAAKEELQHQVAVAEREKTRVESELAELDSDVEHASESGNLRQVPQMVNQRLLLEKELETITAELYTLEDYRHEADENYSAEMTFVQGEN